MKYPFYFADWDNYGEHVSLDTILEYFKPSQSFSTILSIPEKIIKHNIPHGDIYHRCSVDEWNKLIHYVSDKFEANLSTLYQHHLEQRRKAGKLWKAVIVISVILALALVFWFIVRT